MRAHPGYDALLDTLATMDARLVREACVRVPLATSAATADELVASEALATPIRAAVAALAAEIRGRPRRPR